MSTTAAIIEDHVFMRESLKNLLQTCLGLQVRGEFSSAEDATQWFEQEASAPPGLILVDLSLPGKSGIELIEEIKRRWPRTLCVVISGQSDTSYVERSLQAGAEAFVLKGNPGDILDAVRSVLKQSTYLSPELARRMQS